MKKKSGVKSSKGRKSGKKSAKSTGKSSRASSAKKEDVEVDMMNPHAMENLYYIAHGAVDALEIRGFGWTAAPKKKKGKKGKKKK